LDCWNTVGDFKFGYVETKMILDLRFWIYKELIMTKQQLIERNKKFVIEVLMLCDQLHTGRIYHAMVRQLVRCSTSVGANYRAVCRAKSTKDFINKLKIVEEESDEAFYFLDVLYEIDNGKHKDKLSILRNEANELVSIYVASLKTARNNMKAEVLNRKSKYRKY
jgi:four helix bundle protein